LPEFSPRLEEASGCSPPRRDCRSVFLTQHVTSGSSRKVPNGTVSGNFRRTVICSPLDTVLPPQVKGRNEMKGNDRVLRRAGPVGLAMPLSTGLWAAPGLAAPFDYILAVDSPRGTYQVTLTNLTAGQPFSPPVAATHRPGVHMFQIGQLATDELAAIAQ